jgi:hypothetical protein
MQNEIRQDCIERPNNNTTSFHKKIMGESPKYLSKKIQKTRRLGEKNV